MIMGKHHGLTHILVNKKSKQSIQFFKKKKNYSLKRIHSLNLMCKQMKNLKQSLNMNKSLLENSFVCQIR